jgi:mono/diheme cytochrome c family protein
MKKTVWVVAIVLVIASVLLAACGGGGGGGSSSGIKRQPVPSDFASMKNPHEGQQDAVTAGKQLFATNCAPCHGNEGKGDGSAGASLNPKPANLQLTAKETSANYIHWVDTVGGTTAGLSSGMPAFKDVISDDDIWKIATFLTATYGGK